MADGAAPPADADDSRALTTDAPPALTAADFEAFIKGTRLAVVAL